MSTIEEESKGLSEFMTTIPLMPSRVMVASSSCDLTFTYSSSSKPMSRLLWSRKLSSAWVLYSLVGVDFKFINPPTPAFIDYDLFSRDGDFPPFNPALDGELFRPLGFFLIGEGCSVSSIV
jgi:hypothetical protein